MPKQERIGAFNKLVKKVSDSGIETAKGGDVGVQPELVDLDSFLGEYMHLQSGIRKVHGLIRYCLGPTRDVKTPKLQEALAILEQLDDKNTPVTEGLCPVVN